MSKTSVVALDHVAELRRSYEDVGNRTWLTPDFLEVNLETSRELYTPESLIARQPRPKQLDVVALVGGLPFDADFANQLLEVQLTISRLLGDRLHYWVARGNLGVEYCVFKWPAGPWKDEWLVEIRDVLTAIRQPAFTLDIRGVQINPDGCVVAKGFDEGSGLFQIRERLKADVHFLPRRQSGWAHVPLGRILEPLGASTFGRLAELVSTIDNRPIASTTIRSMKLVHETRWYMEEKIILGEYPLSSAAQTLAL
jgi:hypothetical protein